MADLCSDLQHYGAVYWHTTRSNFKRIADEVDVKGVPALSACARANGDFMNFLVRVDLIGELSVLESDVATAIVRWQQLGEPAHGTGMTRSTADGNRRLKRTGSGTLAQRRPLPSLQC